MMRSFHDKCSLTIMPRGFIDDTFSILHPLVVSLHEYTGLLKNNNKYSQKST